jgi:hypothetical protein
MSVGLYSKGKAPLPPVFSIIGNCFEATLQHQKIKIIIFWQMNMREGRCLVKVQIKQQNKI